MRCKNCGTTNPSDAKFCKNCGKSDFEPIVYSKDEIDEMVKTLKEQIETLMAKVAQLEANIATKAPASHTHFATEIKLF